MIGPLKDYLDPKPPTPKPVTLVIIVLVIWEFLKVGDPKIVP